MKLRSPASAETTIGQLMTPAPVVIDAESSVAHARRVLGNYRFRHLPVVASNKPIGMLSDRDFRLASSIEGGSRRAPGSGGPPSVAEIMSQPVVAMTPDDLVSAAATSMLSKRLGAIAVVESDVLVGIITESDLLSAFLERCRLTHYANDDLVRYRMQQPAPSIAPGADVIEALDRIDDDLGHLVVCEEGEMTGIVSARDLLEGVARSIRTDRAAEREGCLNDPRVPVRAVMSRHVATATPGEPLSRVAAVMLGHKFSALPVLDGSEVVGLITQRHVLAHFVDGC